MFLNKEETEIENTFDFLSTITNNFFISNKIESVFLKKLNDADLLKNNKRAESKGNTTHIACTGNSTNFFKDVLGHILLNDDSLNGTNTFPILVPSEYEYSELNDNSFTQEKCTIWINQKSGQESQIGLSKIEFDSSGFQNFRENMNHGDILVFLKYRNKDSYTIYTLLLKVNSNEYNSLPFDTSKKILVKYFHTPSNMLIIDDNGFAHHGVNKIYYGAPGSGKSYKVKENYESPFSDRILFHENYNYNDFIGHIKPVIQKDGNTEEMIYKFIPGPFTSILIKALSNNQNMYTLIIEEMNRANASAVFGDVFQLLDRNSTGISEYSIKNTEIFNQIKDCEFYVNNNEQIYIPNNLNIIATMNNSDQNTFTVDTAFKRRWQFEYVPIIFDNHPFKDRIVPIFNITWQEFIEIINTFMMSSHTADLLINEDKQIGPFFVRIEDLENPDLFFQKIFLYLWDDVFKYDRNRIFIEEINSFNVLLKKVKSDRHKVFVPELAVMFSDLISKKANE